MKPGKPDPSSVGTPGASGEGFALPTASARNRPDLTCGAAPPAEPNIACTSPVITAASAGPVPLYGMRTTFTPAMWLNMIAARKFEVPTPPTEKLSSPGLDFASAISCFADFTGIDG